MTTTRVFDPARMCGFARRSNDQAGEVRSHGKVRVQDGTGKGQPCRQYKGAGTDHSGSGYCVRHTGNTPTGEATAAKERATKALAMLGIPLQVDPQQALLEQVWEAAGNVAFLRDRVQKLVMPPVNADEVAEAAGRAKAAQLYGADHTGAGRPHVLVQMYDAERHRLALLCKLAIDANIAEAALNIAEHQADAIVAVVTRVLDWLAPAPEQRRGAQAVAVAALREFAGYAVVATPQPVGSGR